MTARKRANGEGTITYHKARRLWCAVVSLDGGKRKFLYARSRKEAAKRLADVMSQRQAGLPVSAGKRSVAVFLKTWLAESVKPNVRPWTYHGYEAVVRVHLQPSLGRVDLQDLRPEQVQALMRAKLEAGLSPKTVQSIRGVLRTALNEALRWELVHRNVATLVRPPRSEAKAVSPFTPDEARRLLEAARADRLGALYSVALTLGLRQGEALGLTWDHVDLAEGTLRIERQLQRVDRRLQLVPLKTRSSRRTLPMPTLLLDSLRRHQQAQEMEKRAAGSRWQELGLVFTSPFGTGLDGPTVTKSFQRMLRAADLPRKRFHDLRHSCASLLLVQNVSPRVVMEILGHSQISLTMNTYSHVLPELRRDAANSIDAILRRR